jgi:hypothetical protein
VGGELVETAPQLSYTEQFYNCFPFYLSIGMTYDQYWNSDCLLVKYYREAFDIRKKRENESLWLQGAYIYDALCAVSPVLHAFAKAGTKPQPYLDAPYPLTKKESEDIEASKRKADRQRARAIFEAWASGLDLPEHKSRGE